LRILVVAANSGEIVLLVAKLPTPLDSGERLQHSIYINYYVDVLIIRRRDGGDAAWCARGSRATYDLA
jgi:hypothetical protein